ncbi:MAG TPA: PBP1A family penicillin-binding protein [Vicinamibacterales bacterium]|nr:PBP1A family penicillin-binding protein [Vicinamibacterales bacterium]
MKGVVIRIARRAGLVLLFAAAALLGTATGVLFAYSDDLPRISALDDYTPSTITRVYDASGEWVGEFAVQRRIVIGYDDIAPVLRQAILAAEDDQFFQHFGLSVQRIVITAVKDILYGRMAGASTLTQQLARDLFLREYFRGGIYERSLERKIKEAIVAIQIEKRYTKQEIFTMYCNQMYFGHGAYGVEAAARLYFGKSAKEVTLDEAALLAGIIQGNVRQSPFVNMAAALRRRNYTLDRMAEVGFITREQAEAAKRRPIVVRGEPTPPPSIAPYFLEEVRKQLEARYGAKALYEGGLAVRTTLDARLQRLANRAIEEGLRRLDKRIRGFRRPTRNLAAEGQDPARFRHPRWDRAMGPGDVVPAIVTGVEPGAIHVRAGRRTGTIERAGFAWTRRRAATDLVRAGDLIEVRLEHVRPDGTFTGELEQPPAIEGALLALENRSGRVLAMVGGFSFERSKFNRATQAARQVGSAFKPFVYTAAIDRGYTPASIILDAPVAYDNGPNQPPYTPENYDHTYWGPITLRRAVEQSRNIPAVRVTAELGPAQVAAYARRLGLRSTIPPYLSIALGAAEATLLEMTSAYSAFPNQGVRMAPFLILSVSDRDGNVLEEHRPEPRDAIRADTAFVMTNLLRGVVLRGTAAKAAALDWPLAGKTGTTNDYTDAWFIGFDPDITVGVWVGYDQKRSLGAGFTGAEAALPIWMDFMKAYIATRKDRPRFEPPGNIVFVSVDRATGAPVDPASPEAMSEAFIAGTQPGAGIR